MNPVFNQKTLQERQSARAQWRVQRQAEECGKLLPLVRGIKSIVQVGIGHWYEGPHLLRAFPSAKYFGIEPIDRYIGGAKAKGFPGEIVKGVAFNQPGLILDITDRREKTSVFVSSPRFSIKVKTFTVDQLFSEVPGPVFLWMDCEGGELLALKGASMVLKKSEFVLSEVSQKTRSGYAKSDEVVSVLKAHGFHQIAKHKSTALFSR